MSELPNDLRAKVLIAEDDAIVALDLQGMVMRLGYDVVAIADSGQAAIASARRFLPDIILLDMVLAGTKDGIEVANEIQATMDVPIVFCLSSPDLSSLVRAKDISYAGYLLKPINPDSLSTTLDTVLYKYKLEKRVQKAEEKSRKLAEKFGILRFFFEENATFEWSWRKDEGLRLVSVEDRTVSPAMPDDLKGLFSRLGDYVASWIEPGNASHLSMLLDCDGQNGERRFFAAIGIKDQANGSVSGALIPLAVNNLACLPK